MTEIIKQPLTAELFERYSNDILRYAYSIVRNTDDAKDVLQDVFLRYHRFEENFRGDCSYKTWLFTITRNICYDKLKTVKIMKDIDTLKYEPAPGFKISDLIELNSALGRLAPEENEIIYLKDFERYSYKEIALILEISLDNVRTKLFRAKRKLRKMLEE
jgi:RNA polymerase sigma-70 factor (ECF subfamily)